MKNTVYMYIYICIYIIYYIIYINIYIYIYIPLFVTLKKVYDQNVVNKYALYLLLGVIIYNLIDLIYYIYIYYIYTKWLVVSQMPYLNEFNAWD